MSTADKKDAVIKLLERIPESGSYESAHLAKEVSKMLEEILEEEEKQTVKVGGTPTAVVAAPLRAAQH